MNAISAAPLLTGGRPRASVRIEGQPNEPSRLLEDYEHGSLEEDSSRKQPRLCCVAPIGRPSAPSARRTDGDGVNKAAQHCDLVAQHQQLDLIGDLAPPAQHDQLEEAAQDPVAKGHDHSSMLTDASSSAPRLADRRRTGLSAATGSVGDANAPVSRVTHVTTLNEAELGIGV